MGSDPIALPGLEAIRSGSCGDIELVAVYTQPDRARGRGKKVVANEIKTWALESGIPVFQPEKLGRFERERIASMEADAILVMAYGHILSQALLDTPRHGIWNLHTSLLPQYRGASPIQCAVANGDGETGVTLMRLVKEMDAGPIVDAEKVSIDREDTALEVESKLSEACVPLLRRNLVDILEGRSQVFEQDVSRASYVRKLGKDDGDIDFRQSSEVVARRINGLFPWPGVRFYHGDVPIKVGLAVSVSEAPHEEPGTVLSWEQDGLHVSCANGVVCLKKLQRPGGKMLEADDFLRGYPLSIGTVLESRPMPELISSQPFRA